MLRTTRDASQARHIAAAGLVVLAVFAACSTREEPDGGRPVEETTPATEPVTSGGDIAKATPVTPVSYDEAEAAFREKRFGDAVEKFSAFTDQHPDNPWGHYMLGLSAWKAGDRVTAEGAFVKALERDPKHVKSLVNLGRVLLEDERPREAREKITAALAVDSTSGEVHRLMGRVQSELKQHEEALVSYRRALSLDPADTWSMNNMALIFILQDRYEEALPALARATQLEPTVAVFQNNLGIALERSGRYALATEAYKAAVAADSGYNKAVMSLARVQSLTDDPSLAPIDLSLLAENFDKQVRTVAVKP